MKVVLKIEIVTKKVVRKNVAGAVRKMNTQFCKKHSNERRMPKNFKKPLKNSKTSGTLVVGPSFSDKTYLLLEELIHETKQEGNGLLLFR